MVMNAYDESVWEKIKKDEEKTSKINSNEALPRVGLNGVEPSFIVWGDSHAQALFPVIDEVAKEYGLGGYMTAIGGCPPLLGVDRTDINNYSFNVYKFNNEVINYIKKNKTIKYVYLIGFWEAYIGNIGYHNNSKIPENDKLKISIFKTALNRTVDILTATGCKVIIVTDVPNFSYDVIKDQYFRIVQRDYKQHISLKLVHYNKSNDKINDILKSICQSKKISLIKLDTMLFDDSGNAITNINNKILYKDTNHLSRAGAMHLKPLFMPYFKEISLPLLIPATSNTFSGQIRTLNIHHSVSKK